MKLTVLAFALLLLGIACSSGTGGSASDCTPGSTYVVEADGGYALDRDGGASSDPQNWDAVARFDCPACGFTDRGQCNYRPDGGGDSRVRCTSKTCGY